MKMKSAGIMMVLTILGSLLLVKCSKDDGTGCFKSAGPVSEEVRSLPGFRAIELHDNVELILTQSSGNNPVKVKTGANLLSGIETIVYGSRLIIRNNNWCNWTRNFHIPVQVFVSVGKLDSLEYRGSGNVSCTNQLVNDSIKVDVWEGAGSIHLRLNMEKSFFTIHQGTVDAKLTGDVWVSFINSNGLGPVEALGLTSQYTYIHSSSPNHVYLNVQQLLSGTIDNIGNIYYSGDPHSISVEEQSTGELIKLE